MKRSHLILPIALAGVVLVILAAPVAASPQPQSDTQQMDTPQSPEPEVSAPDSPFPPPHRCPHCGADCGVCGPRLGHREGKRFDTRGPRHLHGTRVPGHMARAPHGRHNGGRHGVLPSERLTIHGDDLELSQQQIDQLEKAAYDTRLKMIDLESELDKAQLEMRRLMDEGSENATDLKRQLRTISEKRLAIQELRLENWIDSRKILNEDQKKKIDEFGPRMGEMI